MTFREKLTALRKSRGMSQEQLAEELNVSRQSISRWEQGSAMPDAGNLLQLSKIFGVSVDYLLNEGYSSDLDIPKVQEIKRENRNQILFYMLALEVMWAIIQFMTTILLRSVFFSVITFLPFLCAVGGFEYAYRSIKGESRKAAAIFRKKFYKISAWLSSYFPVRLCMMLLISQNTAGLWFECVTLVVYLACAIYLSLCCERLDTTGSGGE